MNDLIEFLQARIDEDEQQARAADVRVAAPNWLVAFEDSSGGKTVVIDPDRMLADLNSKRRIIQEHVHTDQCAYYGRAKDRPEPFIGCVVCHDWDGMVSPEGWCLTLRLLAAPYAGHPDFDTVWSVGEDTQP